MKSELSMQKSRKAKRGLSMILWVQVHGCRACMQVDSFRSSQFKQSAQFGYGPVFEVAGNPSYPHSA